MCGTKLHLMQWENIPKRKHGDEEPKCSVPPSALSDQSRCTSSESLLIAWAICLVTARYCGTWAELENSIFPQLC